MTQSQKVDQGNIAARSDTKDSDMCGKADSEKGTKRNIKYIYPRVGLALQLGIQANTISSEVQTAPDSNAEHTEYAVVMDQEPLSQAHEWFILDTPHNEITSVPSKELFPMDIYTGASNSCTGPPSYKHHKCTSANQTQTYHQQSSQIQ